MAGKRSTTPLFELLQQSRAGAAETRVQPDVGAEPADKPAPASPAPAQPAPPPAPDHAESPVRISGGVVQMPLPFAGVAATVALIAVLAAWILGFRRGEASANDAWMARYDADTPAVIREPDGVPGGGSGAGSQRPPPTQGEAMPPGPPKFITSGRPSGTDPRLDRHNYLQLGSFLRRSEVESAAAVLNARGIDSFAVIDPSTLRRNDGPLYVLFAGLGFPSGEADSEPARRYRAQVLAAGVAWKQSGGVRNFDDANWKLHRP